MLIIFGDGTLRRYLGLDKTIRVGAKYWNLWFYTEDWSYHSLSIGLCDILRTSKDHASEPQPSRTEVLNLWFESAPKHT